MTKLTQENIDAINQVLADLADGKTHREIAARIGIHGKRGDSRVAIFTGTLRILGVDAKGYGRSDHLKASFVELQELRRYKAEREAAERASG